MVLDQIFYWLGAVLCVAGGAAISLWLFCIALEYFARQFAWIGPFFEWYAKEKLPRRKRGADNRPTEGGNGHG